MNKELQVIEDGAYALTSPEELTALLEESLGNTKLTRELLPTLTVPAGGGRTWDLGDDETPAPEVTGVVIWYADTRIYWKAGMEESGGGTPPDCASPDGIIGIGTPGGECETCPLNEWGSGRQGRGKACNERRQLAILRPGQVLPTLLSLPPSSIKSWDQFKVASLNKRKRYYQRVVSFGLEKVEADGGQNFSRVTVKPVRDLSEDENKSIEGIRKMMGGNLSELNAVRTVEGDA